MDTKLNLTQELMIGEINRIKKDIGKIHPEYAREERRRGCKEGCCILICFITIIILYYGLDFYFSTS